MRLLNSGLDAESFSPLQGHIWVSFEVQQFVAHTYLQPKIISSSVFIHLNQWLRWRLYRDFNQKENFFCLQLFRATLSSGLNRLLLLSSVYFTYRIHFNALNQGKFYEIVLEFKVVCSYLGARGGNGGNGNSFYIGQVLPSKFLKPQISSFECMKSFLTRFPTWRLLSCCWWIYPFYIYGCTCVRLNACSLLRQDLFILIMWHVFNNSKHSAGTWTLERAKITKIGI